MRRLRGAECRAGSGARVKYIMGACVIQGTAVYSGGGGDLQEVQGAVMHVGAVPLPEPDQMFVYNTATQPDVDKCARIHETIQSGQQSWRFHFLVVL